MLLIYSDLFLVEQLKIGWNKSVTQKDMFRLECL